MLREIDNYFVQKEEPVRSCLLFLRDYLLQFDAGITEEWKYRMPHYYYKGRMFCYLWVHKKTGQPYIGFADGNQIEHPELIQEQRLRMKIMFVNADEDIPVAKISGILKMAIKLHK
jgi:hypothetical protein